MTDIFDNITIHVDCAQCDQDFDVSAAVVAESQELLDEGCPGTDYECPASLFATLLDRRALRRLASAWRDIERSVQKSVGAVHLKAHPTLKQLLDVADGGAPSDPDPAASDGHAGGEDEADGDAGVTLVLSGRSTSPS